MVAPLMLVIAVVPSLAVMLIPVGIKGGGKGGRKRGGGSYCTSRLTPQEVAVLRRRAL